MIHNRQSINEKTRLLLQNIYFYKKKCADIPSPHSHNRFYIVNFKKLNSTNFDKTSRHPPIYNKETYQSLPEYALHSHCA